MSSKLLDVIYVSDSDDDENVYPIDQPSTSNENFGNDGVAVPPPLTNEIPILLPIYRDILLMKRNGNSYYAMDHVLDELNREPDKIKSYIPNDKVIFLYDVRFKVAVCTTLVIYKKASRISHRRISNAASKRVGHCSTVGKCVTQFFNTPGFANFTVVVPIGSLANNSALFIQKRNKNMSFRHFNPSRAKLSVVETFCTHLTMKRPLNILGFIPRINDFDTAALVWTEIYYFMKGSNNNPFNRSNSEFLSINRRNHNYFYPEENDENPELGKNVSLM